MFSLVVADGVVQQGDPAAVGELVTEGDKGEVVVDCVHHHNLPLHRSNSQTVRPDV